MRAASPHGPKSVLVVALLAVLVAAHERPPRTPAGGPPDTLVPGAAVLRIGVPAPSPRHPASGTALLPDAWSAGPVPPSYPEATAATAHPDFLTADLDARAGALADPRFASVVLIEPARGFGTGFYVAPHWVLTNAHVVGDAATVEVTAYDGVTTGGRVVRRDAERDLALVHVDHPGRPAALFAGPALRIGSPVEAIGHPEGFRYSLARGVVSAVRRHAGVAGVARRKVLHIQTDIVINLGNSGGPLFSGDHVVGVIAWRWGGPNGLSFAVHYREILDFLGESPALPGLVAQGGLPLEAHENTSPVSAVPTSRSAAAAN